MFKTSVILVVGSFMWTACLTTDAQRERAIGPSNNQCLALDSDCKASGDCCTAWCAGGTCALRGGGG
jgi:hypothetical protein